jgi:hypothetical protein
MSDEAEDVEVETVFCDGEHALASYGSHAAELAQAFGNLMSQAMQVPVTHPFHPVALDMLNRLVAQIDPAPKGSRARLVKD